MKTSKSILIFLALSLYGLQNIQAQDSLEDKKAIEATIENYFEGWLTGDTTLIGSAMHPSCHLKFFPRGEYEHFPDVSSRNNMNVFMMFP